jgi:hypothetical protein
VKRVWIFMAMLAAMAVPAGAQDLSVIESDLSTFLGGLGSEILAQLQQGILIGDAVGEAEIGDFPHMYFASSTGAVFTNGIAKNISQEDSPFQLVNFSGIVGQALGAANNQIATDLYNLSRTGFLYPHTRFSFGIGTVAGIEVLGDITYWPQALTGWISGMVLENADMLTVDILSLQLRLRKVLLRDSGFYPAVSAGVGYAYSGTTFGFNLSSIGSVAMGPFSIDFSNSRITLATSLNAVGLDLNISKRLLVFIPYLRFASWYEWGSFSSGLTNMSVTIVSTSTLEPTATRQISGMTFLLQGGMEILLGVMDLTLGGSVNPLTGFLSAELSLGVRL